MKYFIFKLSDSTQDGENRVIYEYIKEADSIEEAEEYIKNKFMNQYLSYKYRYIIATPATLHMPKLEITTTSFNKE